MPLRCRMGIHQHGTYVPDWSYDPVVHVESCPRCGRVLGTEPPTRGFFFHERGVDGTRCPEAIPAGGERAEPVCPGHVLGEDGRQVATMRPLVLRRLSRERAGPRPLH